MMAELKSLNLNNKFSEINQINKNTAITKLTSKGVKGCTGKDANQVSSGLIDNFIEVANDKLKDKNITFDNADALSKLKLGNLNKDNSLKQLNTDDNICSDIDDRNKYVKAEATFYLLFTDEKGELDTSLLTPSSNEAKTQAIKEPTLTITNAAGKAITDPIQLPDKPLADNAIIANVKIENGILTAITPDTINGHKYNDNSGFKIVKDNALQANRTYRLRVEIQPSAKDSAVTEKVITVKTGPNYGQAAAKKADTAKTQNIKPQIKVTNTKNTTALTTADPELIIGQKGSALNAVDEASPSVPEYDIQYYLSEIEGATVYLGDKKFDTTKPTNSDLINAGALKVVWDKSTITNVGFTFTLKDPNGNILKEPTRFEVKVQAPPSNTGTTTQGANNADKTANTTKSSLTSDDIKYIQTFLDVRGLYTEAVDGILSRETRNAIIRAQNFYLISPADGVPSSKLVEELRKDTLISGRRIVPTQVPDGFEQRLAGSATISETKNDKLTITNTDGQAIKEIQIPDDGTGLVQGSLIGYVEIPEGWSIKSWAGPFEGKDPIFTMTGKDTGTQKINVNLPSKLKANKPYTLEFVLKNNENKERTENITIKTSANFRKKTTQNTGATKANTAQNLWEGILSGVLSLKGTNNENTPVPPNQKQFQKLWASNPSTNSPSRLKDLMSLDYVSREVQKKGTSSISIKNEATTRTITKDNNKQDNFVSKLDAEGIYTQENLPILKLGESGEKVILLKHLLNRVLDSFHTNPTSDKFDELTKAAVFKFQKNNGLKEDGIVGKNTWVKLIQKLEISKQVMGAWVNAYVKDDGGKEPNKSVRAFVA